MDIPFIQDYNSLPLSGCSMKYANMHGIKRLYAHGFEYKLLTVNIIAVFDFIWKFKIENANKEIIIRNMPYTYSLQHLMIDNEIDHESFTSLN